MKKIPLTKGKFATVDDQDFDTFSKFKWYCTYWGYAHRTQRYGKRSENKKISRFLHREIIQAKNDEEVDHINGNTLDNRRKNLRIVTHRQNMLNRKMHRNNKTGFRGVTTTKSGRYLASIEFKGKTVSLGRFDTSIEAAKKYNESAIKLKGNWAKINKV